MAEHHKEQSNDAPAVDYSIAACGSIGDRCVHTFGVPTEHGTRTPTRG